MKNLSRQTIVFSQVILLVACWLLADQLVRLAHIPVPASIIALVVMTALLISQKLSSNVIASGARFLLDEMSLFFIPPMLAITRFGSLLAHNGIWLLAAIAIGSIVVMAGTGLIVDRLYHVERKLNKLRQLRAMQDGAAIT